MRRVKYLFLFHPIHTALTAGSAWKSSGLLRGLTGLVLNPGFTLTHCPFPLISFNKQLDFPRSQDGMQTALGKVSASLCAMIGLHPMHLGG